MEGYHACSGIMKVWGFEKSKLEKIKRKEKRENERKRHKPKNKKKKKGL